MSAIGPSVSRHRSRGVRAMTTTLKLDGDLLLGAVLARLVSKSFNVA
jgi:hypothetical protein